MSLFSRPRGPLGAPPPPPPQSRASGGTRGQEECGCGSSSRTKQNDSGNSETRLRSRSGTRRRRRRRRAGPSGTAAIHAGTACALDSPTAGGGGLFFGARPSSCTPRPMPALSLWPCLASPRASSGISCGKHVNQFLPRGDCGNFCPELRVAISSPDFLGGRDSEEQGGRMDSDRIGASVYTGMWR